MTDFVLTYVDNTDSTWYHQYIKYSIDAKRKIDINSVRFRSWDTLQYVFRGIAENMSFINNVYLVVASESQVPKWVNRDNVKIITHNMIIPKPLLPTFNSNTIEMFIHNIPGLSEQFIYSNDDIFAINKLTEEDFFKDGQPIIAVHDKRIPVKLNIYGRSLISTLRLCEKFNDYKIPKGLYLRSNHSMNPMLKSTWKRYFINNVTDIRDSLTRFREPKNITQELSNFHHYIYNKKNKKSITSTRNTVYFYFKNRPALIFGDYLFSDKTQIICMNDAGVIDFNVAKKTVINLFNKKFPTKSKYEI